jgi:hypothetical protein
MESLAYQDTEATPLVAEAAMLCADPAVSNALLRMLYDQLVDVVDRQVIPKVQHRMNDLCLCSRRWRWL